jgi:hypothetical protein
VIVSGQSPLKVAEACSAQAGNVTWMEVLAKVLTPSDSVAARSRVDRSGDAVEALLQANSFVVVERRVVPDGVAPVATALTDLSSYSVGLIVTTGGTGFSQTDLRRGHQGRCCQAGGAHDLGYSRRFPLRPSRQPMA